MAAAADHPIAISVREKLEQAGFHFEPLLPAQGINSNRTTVPFLPSAEYIEAFAEHHLQLDDVIVASFVNTIQANENHHFHIDFEQAITNQGDPAIVIAITRWDPPQEAPVAEASAAV